MNHSLARHEKMLLELLRAALRQEAPLPELFRSVDKDTWIACYELAVTQGVMVIAFDAVMTLPKELLPPLALKVKWALAAEKYEGLYEYYCKTVHELSDFYAQHGILTMQMKGVGFSSYYPHPEHREGGDIDVYTRSADLKKMTDKEANALADTLMEEQGIEVNLEYHKHSSFVFQHIPVENHKAFLDILRWPIEQEAEAYLQQHQQTHIVELGQGKYPVSVPSDEFNTVFLSCHALQHYTRGLCLHHLCDWACLLNRCGLHLPEEIKDPHYLHFVNALTAFTNRYLGTQVPVKVNEKHLAWMEKALLHCRPDLELDSQNPLRILYSKCSRYAFHRRSNKVFCGDPFVLQTLRSAMEHIIYPKRILARKEEEQD